MICTIFATDQVGTFGNRGTLPWPMHAEDMAWFREHTMDQVVVMGKNTYSDPKMPKPLPNRINYVLSSQPIENKKIRRISGDLVTEIKNLELVHPGKKIFILGGPDIIMSCKNIIDYAYITHRKGAAFNDVRIDLRTFMYGMRITSSRPSSDKMLNFCVYKNIDIFR